MMFKIAKQICLLLALPFAALLSGCHATSYVSCSSVSIEDLENVQEIRIGADGAVALKMDRIFVKSDGYPYRFGSFRREPRMMGNVYLLGTMTELEKIVQLHAVEREEMAKSWEALTKIPRCNPDELMKAVLARDPKPLNRKVSLGNEILTRNIPGGSDQKLSGMASAYVRLYDPLGFDSCEVSLPDSASLTEPLRIYALPTNRIPRDDRVAIWFRDHPNAFLGGLDLYRNIELNRNLENWRTKVGPTRWSTVDESVLPLSLREGVRIYRGDEAVPFVLEGEEIFLSFAYFRKTDQTAYINWWWTPLYPPAVAFDLVTFPIFFKDWLGIAMSIGYRGPRYP